MHLPHPIAVDIEGLNLVLGGGVPILRRHDAFGESATLLVRGPPGSGKTILGVQLAGSLARALGDDVAYGCVELLPPELAAQHAGIKRLHVNERVVQAPFTTHEPKGEECRIFAGLLDLGAPGGEVPPIAAAAEGLLKAIETAGGKPRVLVIDSLSDGYSLGAKAPRLLADDLCKLVVRKGMILILLEETVDDTPSAWSFATDVVLQLSSSEDSVRRVAVRKNRFGPSESGAHRFAILPRWGVTVFPQPGAYLSKWASSVILPGWTNTLPQSHGWPFEPPPDWPRFSECVTAVYGPDAVEVHKLVNRLGLTALKGSSPVDGNDVVLDFSRPEAPIEKYEMVPGERWVVGCGAPYLDGAELLYAAIDKLEELRTTKKPLRRVLVGDLQSVRSFRDPDGIRQALGVFVAILRRVQIPAVLFETAAPRTTKERPLIVDFADVVIEIPDLHTGQLPRVSHTRSGQQTQMPRP